MPVDQVLLLQDSHGEVYAIPVDKLIDAKLKMNEAQVQDAVSRAAPPDYKLLGTATMPPAVRRASYVTPNISTNVLMPMPTA
jgi:hypothetical protein